MLRYYWALLERRKSDEGASAVEYGLLVAAIAALIVVIVFALGKIINQVFQDTCDSIQSQASINESCN